MNVCQRNVARFVHVECRFYEIKDIARVLEAWCHCDYRKMEALKVNTFGRNYRNGTQAPQLSLRGVIIFLIFMRTFNS